MPSDYIPKTFTTKFTAGDATQMSQQLNEEENINTAQQVSIDSLSKLSRNVINVLDYGADPTGAVASDAAFLAAYTAAVAGSVATYSTVNRAVHEVYIPLGTYLINGNGKLIADLAITTTSGIRFRGAGMDATTIAFNPSAGNGYLATNQDDLVHLTFQDLSFYCTGTNAATATFLKSTTANAGWDVVFDRCKWDGVWKYGLDLTGTDTNSDIAWYSCGIHGSWTSFLHAGASSTSDNFVNYSFYSPQVWVTGDFIDLAKGGNVNVYDGSLIHIADATETTSTPSCFFKLGVGGPVSHSSGVQRLLVLGARVEHRHEDSSLIQCGWTAGNVSFISCDTAAFAPLLASPNNVVQATFGLESWPMPEVVFDGCMLMGKHEYHFDGGAYQNRQQIEYRSCELVTHATASDFVTYVNDDATNLLAGQPPVKFRNCRGNTSTQIEQFDCTVGWPLLVNAVVEPRVLSMKHSWGGGPITGATTLTANLPLNSIITRVRAWKAASGSATSTTFTYVLHDATPTTIATIAPGTAWNAGWSYDSGALFYRCTTNTKRQLTLEATVAVANEFGDDIYFLVEYLA